MSRSRLALAAAFTTTGVLHFARPGMYEAIMPDELPAHRELVYASGVTEAVGGLAVLHPRTRRFGGWLLIATMAGVFPAHIHMLVRRERYRKIPTWGLWARLPLQLVFVEAIRRAALRD